MPHALALAVEVATTALAVAGMGYFIAAMIAARSFLAARRAKLAAFSPNVSILKSLKGLDPGMLDAFRSHCRQNYAGDSEMLFAVSSLDDPAAAAVEQLQREFPDRVIRLLECPERLGTNGKVSALLQLVPHARYDFLLINDSDITVGPRYLERVMASFTQDPGVYPQNPTPVGLVTALYRGRAHADAGLTARGAGHCNGFSGGGVAVEEDGGRPALRPWLHAGGAARGPGANWRPGFAAGLPRRRLRNGRADSKGRLPRRALARSGRDRDRCLRLARVHRPPASLGADGARRAAHGAMRA